ncbi:MAG: YkgJ family cysteine cluster protein [Candidatus Magnetomorum sp.]|nr:YkgJ family cysteine cluster protein [Candidatus Magnetomorum sp.]
MINIFPEQVFFFRCHPKIQCFNACCQDLHQILTPYDIIRLKHHFQIDSSIFLKTYTRTYIGPETGLPVVVLKTKSHMDLRCIFVSEEGCLVYPDRPASCRYYPLARLVSRSRETGKISASYMLMKEAHCMGHNDQKGFLCEQTLEKWLDSQELANDDNYNDRMLEIIAVKNQAGIKDLSADQKKLFFMCCYDIDSFQDYAVNDQLFSEKLDMHCSFDGDLQWLERALAWLKNNFLKISVLNNCHV